MTSGLQLALAVELEVPAAAAAAAVSGLDRPDSWGDPVQRNEELTTGLKIGWHIIDLVRYPVIAST